jgi:hypothetical protein
MDKAPSGASGTHDDVESNTETGVETRFRATSQSSWRFRPRGISFFWLRSEKHNEDDFTNDVLPDGELIFMSSAQIFVSISTKERDFSP